MAEGSDRGSGETTPKAMAGDWSATGDFLGSVLAGLGLGLLVDWLLSTSPWFTVAGVIAGFGVGFRRMMEYSKKIMDEAAKAQRRRKAEPEPDDDDWLD